MYRRVRRTVKGTCTTRIEIETRGERREHAPSPSVLPDDLDEQPQRHGSHCEGGEDDRASASVDPTLEGCRLEQPFPTVHASRLAIRRMARRSHRRRTAGRRNRSGSNSGGAQGIRTSEFLSVKALEVLRCASFLVP